MDWNFGSERNAKTFRSVERERESDFDRFHVLWTTELLYQVLSCEYYCTCCCESVHFPSHYSTFSQKESCFPARPATQPGRIAAEPKNPRNARTDPHAQTAIFCRMMLLSVFCHVSISERMTRFNFRKEDSAHKNVED